MLFDPQRINRCNLRLTLLTTIVKSGKYMTVKKANCMFNRKKLLNFFYRCAQNTPGMIIFEINMSYAFSVFEVVSLGDLFHRFSRL